MASRAPTEEGLGTPQARTLSVSARAALAVAGAAALGAGVTAVFAVRGNGGAGAAALIAAGAVALTVAAVGVLPTNLAVGGVELTLPERVQRLAEEAARLGRPDVAESLKVSAELAAAAEPFGQIYDSIRKIAPGFDERTQALDALVRLVARQAGEGRWSPSEARALFESQQEGARVFALAMLRAFPAPDNLDIALDAVTAPKSRFEHWHALVVVELMLPHLDRDQLVRVQRALDALQLPEPGSRADKRAEILAILNEREMGSTGQT